VVLVRGAPRSGPMRGTATAVATGCAMANGAGPMAAAASRLPVTGDNGTGEATNEGFTSKECNVFLASITCPEGKVGIGGSGWTVSLVVGRFSGDSSFSLSTTADDGIICGAMCGSNYV
jgi:hypothetical protein